MWLFGSLESWGKCLRIKEKKIYTIVFLHRVWLLCSFFNFNFLFFFNVFRDYSFLMHCDSSLSLFFFFFLARGVFEFMEVMGCDCNSSKKFGRHKWFCLFIGLSLRLWCSLFLETWGIELDFMFWESLEVGWLLRFMDYVLIDVRFWDWIWYVKITW